MRRFNLGLESLGWWVAVDGRPILFGIYNFPESYRKSCMFPSAPGEQDVSSSHFNPINKVFSV